MTEINVVNCSHDKYRHLIDKSCPKKFIGKVHIHINNGHLLLCTLNQTDLQSNSNKYYIFQLLKHDCINSFFLISRSGRVGSDNKINLKCFLNEEKAIETFKKTFNEKTGYFWEDRFDMSKKEGKYDYIEIEIDKENLVNKHTTTNPNSDQILDSQVEKFISLIFDLDMFKKTMKEFKIDTHRKFRWAKSVKIK